MGDWALLVQSLLSQGGEDNRFQEWSDWKWTCQRCSSDEDDIRMMEAGGQIIRLNERTLTSNDYASVD